MFRNPRPARILALALLVLASGCDDRDERLAQLARQHAEMQSRQQEEMATLHREVASGSRQLIAAQAVGTDKLLAMQGALQQQYQELERVRRALAEEQRRESLLAPVISGLGAILLAILPLLVCMRLLGESRNEPPETEISGLLMDELLATEPSRRALPPGPADAVALPTTPDSPSDCEEEGV